MGLKLEKNPNWKGGRTITPHGYAMVKADRAKYSVMTSGYIYEHKLIMEIKIGRKLKKDEIVHHINHNKLDNRPENLILCTKRVHKYLHRKKDVGRIKPGEKNKEISCACGCGKKIMKYDRYGRPREYSFGCNCTKGKGKKYKVELILCKCGCGVKINKYDKYGRERKYISGHNGGMLCRKHA